MTAADTSGWQAADLDGAADDRDLSRPRYGARFGAAAGRFFRKYGAFQGRASRSEYWWAQLLIALIHLVPAAITLAGFIPAVVWQATTREQFIVGDMVYERMPGLAEGPTGLVVVAGIGALLWVAVWAALLVPSIAVAWRRLHDANLPGPLWFLSLVPSVGGIILIVLALLPSKAEGRRFDGPRTVSA